MASFIEEATLKVNDQSSAALKKINAELKKLFDTANKLHDIKIDIKVDVDGVSKAIAEVNKLTAEVNALKAAAKSVKVNVTAGKTGATTTAVTKLAGALQGLHGRTSVTMNVNATGLTRAQAQLASLRQQAAGGIPVRFTGAGAGAGGGGAGGTGGRGAGGRVWQGVGGGVRGVAAGISGIGVSSAIMYSIGSAIGRGIVAGAKETDTGRTSMQLKQYDRVYGPGALADALHETNQAQKEADKERGGAFWGVGTRRKMISEVSPITGVGRRPSGQWDFQPAAALTRELEEMTRMLVGLGMTQERAEEQAISYAKGLEQAERITDSATGKFDVGKMEQQFAYLRKLQPTIGKEFTGDFFKGIVKYLSATKYAIKDEALGAVLLLGEEYGTRAAVGYGQMVKQLSGIEQKKPQLEFLKKHGLLTTEEVLTGYTGTGKRRKPKYTTKVKDVVDQELLQTNAPKWVSDHLVPILEQLGREEAVKKGIMDPVEIEKYVRDYKSDPQKIYDLANKVVGDRTARDAVMAMLVRAEEIQRQLGEAARRSGRPEDIRKATELSINIATAQIANQFKGAAGEMIHAAAPWLVPQMKAGSEAFSKFSTKFQGGKFPGAADFGELFQALTPAGLGAAFMGMMDPATAPMATAAAGLIIAGNLLVSAANILMKKPEQPGLTPAGMPTSSSVEAARVAAIQQGIEEAKTEEEKARAEVERLSKPPKQTGQIKTQDILDAEQRLRERLLKAAQQRWENLQTSLRGLEEAKRLAEEAQTRAEETDRKARIDSEKDRALKEADARAKAEKERQRLMEKKARGGKLTKEEERKIQGPGVKPETELTPKEKAQRVKDAAAREEEIKKDAAERDRIARKYAAGQKLTPAELRRMATRPPERIKVPAPPEPMPPPATPWKVEPVPGEPLPVIPGAAPGRPHEPGKPYFPWQPGEMPKVGKDLEKETPYTPKPKAPYTPIPKAPPPPSPLDIYTQPPKHPIFLQPPESPVVLQPPLVPVYLQLPMDAPSKFEQAFSGVGTALTTAGSTAGTNATSTMQGAAGSIGNAIGSAAAAIISAARVTVDIPGSGGAPKADPGGQSPGAGSA